MNTPSSPYYAAAVEAKQNAAQNAATLANALHSNALAHEIVHPPSSSRVKQSTFVFNRAEAAALVGGEAQLEFALRFIVDAMVEKSNFRLEPHEFTTERGLPVQSKVVTLSPASYTLKRPDAPESASIHIEFTNYNRFPSEKVQAKIAALATEKDGV